VTATALGARQRAGGALSSRVTLLIARLVVLAAATQGVRRAVMNDNTICNVGFILSNAEIINSSLRSTQRTDSYG